MTQTLPDHLKRLCRILSHVSSVGLLLLAAVFIYFAAYPTRFDTLGVAELPPNGVQHLLLMAVLAAILAPGVIALLNLRRMLVNYANGRVLTFENAKAIRTIGIAVLLGTVATILGRTLTILILTATNPPGQRSLAVSLSSHDYFYVLFGGLLFVMGWVMAEASRQADENRQFV